MRIVACEVWGYTLPLINPLSLKGLSIHFRSGFLIKCIAESGGVGWGDIAPIPQFSSETWETIKEQVPEFTQNMIGVTIDKTTVSLERLLEPLSTMTLYPSVRFGLETAMCNLAAEEWATSVSSILSTRINDFVFINALLTGGMDTICESAEQAKHNGYKTLKVKVGQGALVDDIECINKVCDIANKDMTIRLDANQAWTLDEALTFSRTIQSDKVEYIEEPLKASEDLAVFMAESSLPVALDESLINRSNIEDWQGIKAVIIKPTLLGGILQALNLSNKARSLGIRSVISSTFESGVGICALVQLAAAIGDRVTSAGLDTYRWLKKDVLSMPIPFRGGCIKLDELEKSPPEIRCEELQDLTYD
ncbi:MAG: o-succinylbenzoate synthase [Kiritimatiellae bacterium]|nr:o-succinylbenzoate synthase [Kiritimatiellia bacterium]